MLISRLWHTEIIPAVLLQLILAKNWILLPMNEIWLELLVVLCLVCFGAVCKCATWGYDWSCCANMNNRYSMFAICRDFSPFTVIYSFFPTNPFHGDGHFYLLMWIIRAHVRLPAVFSKTHVCSSAILSNQTASVS